MNIHNTTKIFEEINSGNIMTAIDMLKRLPFNHKRYAFVYHRILLDMYLSCITIGPLSREIHEAFFSLPVPYIFTMKYIRKTKGGVINE